jgi:hypothetical protein
VPITGYNGGAGVAIKLSQVDSPFLYVFIFYDLAERLAGTDTESEKYINNNTTTNIRETESEHNYNNFANNNPSVVPAAPQI